MFTLLKVKNTSKENRKKLQPPIMSSTPSDHDDVGIGPLWLCFLCIKMYSFFGTLRIIL